MKARLSFIASTLALIMGFASCTDSEPEGGTLEISESSFSVGAEGTTLRVRVSSEETWRVSSGAHWCIPYNEEGENGEELALSVVANVENEKRSAQVTVVSGTSYRTIEIEQDASDQNAEEYHYTLPVIFHVIYQDPTDNTQYVAPERLETILNRVNLLYQAQTGTESEDMNLTFTLATIGPDGQELATPGVEYIQWQGEYPINCEEFMTESSGRYAEYIWEPNLYINVMLYAFEQTEPGVTTLGISHMAFSTEGETYLEGLQRTRYTFVTKSNLNFPYCVSINSEYIYSSSSSSDICATLAHELGHYLGLHHVFSEDESGNMTQDCVDSDYCDDTPTYDKIGYEAWRMFNSGESFNVLAQRIDCESGATFTSRNILDYAYSYHDQFTSDQRERVRHVLMYSPLIPGPKLTQSGGGRSAADGKADLTPHVVK